MAIVTTLRYNSNSVDPQPGGDLVTAIFDITVAAGGNTYPAGGEAIDFSSVFAEAHIVAPTVGFNPTGGGNADADGALAVGWERDTANTGRLRFFQGPDALDNLPEIPVDAYANAFQFSILVMGRPITDSF